MDLSRYAFVALPSLVRARRNSLGLGVGGVVLGLPVYARAVTIRPDAAALAVAFSPVRGDYRALTAGGAEDGQLHLWDVPGEKELAVVDFKPAKTDATVYVGQVAFSPDGKRALSCHPDRSVRVWDVGRLEKDKELHALKGQPPGLPTAAAFSPDGKKIVTFHVQAGGVSNTLLFWDVGERSKLASCPLPNFGVRPTVNGWSPDSLTLAAATANGVALFRAPWDKCAQTIARPGGPTALAWSPDGKFLATVEPDKLIHVLDLERGESVADVTGFKISRPELIPAWSPDGKELAFATEDRKVIVWNLAEKKATFTFAGHKRPINAVAFLDDNKTLVSGSGGGMRFWDLEKYRLRGTLLHLAGAGWLAIGPDGNYRCSENAEARFFFKVREDNDRLREYSPKTSIRSTAGRITRKK